MEYEYDVYRAFLYISFQQGNLNFGTNKSFQIMYKKDILKSNLLS